MMRTLFKRLFSYNPRRQFRKLGKNYHKELIYHHYSEESLKEKRFYNIGAGNQRSQYDFWTYIDLKSSLYSKKGIDIFYDLEALEPLPLKTNSAEVVFNSFLIEHISVNATKNLCREAYRVLKKGGIFHSKVHCYDYGIELLRHGLPSHRIPFGARESTSLVRQFIIKHRGHVTAFFNKHLDYIIQSTTQPADKLIFSTRDTFIIHNATAAYDNSKKYPKQLQHLLANLTTQANIKKLYKTLKEHYVDPQKTAAHQHNADYFSQKDLFAYIKKLGFSEVSFRQPYQSMSPVLWEEALNPTYSGFIFTIEAIK